jgi:hypothetical protein
MTEQEKVDNAHILDGLTIHNTVDSDGQIGVLLNGVKDGHPSIAILTTLKILEGAVKAINEEIEKEIIKE